MSDNTELNFERISEGEDKSKTSERLEETIEEQNDEMSTLLQ